MRSIASIPAHTLSLLWTKRCIGRTTETHCCRKRCLQLRCHWSVSRVLWRSNAWIVYPFPHVWMQSRLDWATLSGPCCFRSSDLWTGRWISRPGVHGAALQHQRDLDKSRSSCHIPIILAYYEETYGWMEANSESLLANERKRRPWILATPCLCK